MSAQFEAPAAEAAADVARQHVDAPLGEIPNASAKSAWGRQHLHRGIDGQLRHPTTMRWWRKAPSGSGSGSAWCKSGRSGPARLERRLEVADPNLVIRNRLCLGRIEGELARRLLIGDCDQIGRGLGGLQGFGGDEGDRLAEEGDLGVREHRLVDLGA